MTSKALGLIETIGLTAAIEAADAAVKAANVTLLGYENARGGGLITIKLAGDVGAVKAAVSAGSAAALRIGQVKSCLVIPRPHDEIEILIDQVDRGRAAAPAAEKPKPAITTASRPAAPAPKPAAKAATPGAPVRAAPPAARKPPAAPTAKKTNATAPAKSKVVARSEAPAAPQIEPAAVVAPAEYGQAQPTPRDGPEETAANG